jgi:hypothetical protein
MDCRAAMSRWVSTLLLALVVAGATPARAGEQLVLIVSARSDLTQLGSAAVRKIFLGLTVTRSGNRIHPLLNESDAHLKAVFLQNVVSMSDETYDRRILRLTLQEGRTLPAGFRDTAQLLDAVAEDPYAVSYVWMKDVEMDKRIRVLRVLWSD